MTRSVIVLGVVAALAVTQFAAQEARPPARADLRASETDLTGRVTKLQDRTALVEEQLDRLKGIAERLESALKKSEATVATLSKQVKAISEAQERLARAVTVDPSGAVRITGNLRLENNTLDDVSVINCDVEGTTGGSRRRCTCPEGLIAIGIELRPLALSAYPGPATYNTTLVCGRL